MCFHMRRAIAYIAASILVFIILISLTADDFRDLHDNDTYLPKPKSQRIQHSDLDKWKVKVIRPGRGHIGLNVTEPRPRRTTHAPAIIHRRGGIPSSEHLWPDGESGDRILAQIKHIPQHYDKETAKVKVIFAPAGLGETPEGRDKFIEEQCPVDACALTTDRNKAKSAHAVLLQSSGLQDEEMEKTPGQIWILWVLESPSNTINFNSLGDRINWTATYRQDSTIVTPYEKFVPFPNASAVISQGPTRNYAKGKTKMAAWFVSNCGARNQRWDLVRELQEYIEVDIYGACGTYTCFRHEKDRCDKLLNKEYKFYLSFENSNCVDYVTEKFYWNALWNDIVPVVLGARKEDYAAVSPPHSFIHIEDFDSVYELAKYLLMLDQYHDLYNQYFSWKGSGEFINTKFWCRLCSLLHTAGQGHDGKVMWYSDIERWWRSKGICSRRRWDDHEALISNWDQFYLSN